MLTNSLGVNDVIFIALVLALVLEQQKNTLFTLAAEFMKFLLQ